MTDVFLERYDDPDAGPLFSVNTGAVRGLTADEVQQLVGWLRGLGAEIDDEDLAPLNPAEWHLLDSIEATEEGWDVFYAVRDVEDEVESGWEIQADDGKGLLASDEEAWELVRTVPSELHTRALAFIKANNPAEYERWMGAS